MNVLLRGLSPTIHKRIRKMANQRDESLNKMLLDIIKDAVDRVETEEEKRREQEEAFRRLKEIREKNSLIFGRGSKGDDAVSMIREAREERIKRLL